MSLPQFTLANSRLRVMLSAMIHPFVVATRKSAAILSGKGEVRRSSDTPPHWNLVPYTLLVGLATFAALAEEPATAPASDGTSWQSMLNGTDLTGWQPINFGGEGEVEYGDGVLVLPRGQPFTGVRFTNEFPTLDYEISLEARRVSGSDFFCGLTVPVGTNFCSLIVGGWGGGLVGISSLDGMDASENETMSIRAFEQGRWYRIRMRIAEGRIEVWIDDECVVNVSTVGRTIGLRRGAIEDCRPLGLCSYVTDAENRSIQWRRLAPAGASQSSARIR